MSVGQSTLTNKHIGVPSAPIDSTGARLPFLTAWGRSLPCWTMITTAFLLMVDQGDAVGGKHVLAANMPPAKVTDYMLYQ
ncbi:hypothetical protein PoMZ_10397 [Pyricularia oryzae]|uniref:Uncharacterized protein n=1 Tax=Pyricularia oryzae TaxID=318829 RepID=A0A4P7MX92_PYROR|nr:hypothetical protein PoMZ_10397 [Pyricularia oryzae]